jgi:hypothetical protein
MADRAASATARLWNDPLGTAADMMASGVDSFRVGFNGTVNGDGRAMGSALFALATGGIRNASRATIGVEGNRGLVFVREYLGEADTLAKQIARDFESGTTGAFSDIATRQRAVPALRYDNPNPAGAPYVKFDGHQTLESGNVEMIDAKTRVLTFSTSRGSVIPTDVRDGLVRQSLALAQNPGYVGVIELPTSVARREAQLVLRQLGITNISTRVR